MPKKIGDNFFNVTCKLQKKIWEKFLFNNLNDILILIRD